MGKFRIYTEPRDYGRCTALTVLIEEPDGRLGIAEPMVFRVVPQDGLAGDAPTLGAGRRDLDGRAFLQACLDHAWEIGLRPSGMAEADTTKQVAALTYHLEDMRKMVFGPKAEG